MTLYDNSGLYNLIIEDRKIPTPGIDQYSVIETFIDVIYYSKIIFE